MSTFSPVTGVLGSNNSLYHFINTLLLETHNVTKIILIKVTFTYIKLIRVSLNHRNNYVIKKVFTLSA